jgi:hypothetical protein
MRGECEMEGRGDAGNWAAQLRAKRRREFHLRAPVSIVRWRRATSGRPRGWPEGRSRWDVTGGWCVSAGRAAGSSHFRAVTPVRRGCDKSCDGKGVVARRGRCGGKGNDCIGCSYIIIIWRPMRQMRRLSGRRKGQECPCGSFGQTGMSAPQSRPVLGPRSMRAM